MEDGSLLPNALRSMQKLRENEQNLNFPFHHFFEPQQKDENNRPLDSNLHLGTRNALVISLYCIDSGADVNLGLDADAPLHRKQLLRKLASIHNLIHTKIIPVYNKRYKHNWFTGGEGICFGLHCQDVHSTDDHDQSRTSKKPVWIPHLRSVVSYGPHPLDEFFAIAMMKCITVDLRKHYNFNVAVECWDVDDGQILLIEGANTLPSWVDDVGVEGMAKRVYFVDGNVCLLPPSVSVQSKSDDGLTRREALAALLKEEENNYASTFHSPSLVDFNRAIQSRLNPFCKVLNNQAIDATRIRSILGEYLHTAAIVLPLHLAILIRHRPDLISVAILSFCRHATDSHDTTPNKESNSTPGAHDIQEGAEIPFENLVYTCITLPKTLYAMLLTAAGQLPPPMKTPKHYKSMEFNRIKRQCKNGGVAYAHFRHALEAGQRLSLGFEWITCPSGQGQLRGVSEGTGTSKEEKANHSLISCSPEERINDHTVRMDIEAGGDGVWIQRAWDAGPNATEEDDKIDALLKCPIWIPEILKGGICPIRHPGKTIAKHVQEASKFAKKRELSNKDTAGDFPVPRADQVDADDWIDLDSMDDLEHKMNSIVGASASMKQSTANANDDGKDLTAMDSMMEGLEKFVSGSSDIRGVTSDGVNPDESKQEEKDSGDIHIDERVYLEILQRTLKVSDAKDLRLDDIVPSTRSEKRSVPSKDAGFSSDLLKYFSNDDLDFDGDTVDDADFGETDLAMKELMKSMDEQLAGEELEREFKVPGEEGDDIGGQDKDKVKLSFDDPTAIKASVLSNILESLDAQGGSSGPAMTLLAETKS